MQCHVHVFLSDSSDLMRAVKTLKTMQQKGRPSISRTDAKAERVRQMISGDHRLTIQIMQMS